MSSPDEVIVSSDASGQLWNSCVWDLQSGTSLLTFKGGTSAPKTLDLIKKEYLIAASNTKPVLHVWPLQKKESNQIKMVCPGIVTSLTVTPDGSYCIAGVAEKIHIWQVCTGSLLAVLSRHYQSVHCLKCTDDGSTFVSGGDDNLVIVWSLGVILAESENLNTVIKPRHVWASHSLPVTDIHIGVGGSRARVVSSSLDQTCRMWHICSGELLCKIVFNVSIMSVTMDTAEFQLFAGGNDGVIYSVNLFEMPIRTERHFQDTKENKISVKFQGHSKKVSCLSLSLDGTHLVSGSHDSTVKVWDVYSGQCIRTLSHKGSITNAFIIPCPQGVLDSNMKPSTIIQTFQRHMIQDITSIDAQSGDVLNIKINKSDMVNQSANRNLLPPEVLNNAQFQTSPSGAWSKEEDLKLLREEILKLKTANQELYRFSVDEILHGNSKIT